MVSPVLKTPVNQKIQTAAASRVFPPAMKKPLLIVFVTFLSIAVFYTSIWGVANPLTRNGALCYTIAVGFFFTALVFIPLVWGIILF